MGLTAGIRLGAYEVVSHLGAGGMGEVYRARHLKLDRDVAIKVLPSDLASDVERRRRFEREARAASALNHPNIITVHDIDEHDGNLYIAMELVQGRTLRELLAEAPFPVGRLLALARQIAEGLAKAHLAEIVHRDLKPENLMVTEDGLVKILDFGLAKLAPKGTESGSDVTTVEQPTRAGVVLGTAPYMSPEQAAGRPVDFRSDQFSFGSILYEVATGRQAFKKDTMPQTLAAIIESEPEALGRLNPALPADLVAIAERCLAKDPGKRFASTRELATALAAAPEAPAVSPVRRRVLWTAVGVVAGGLGFALLPNACQWWHSLIPGPATPVIQAIAVLPLQNLSGDPEQEYFSDGLTETLIAHLAKIGDLSVIARSSVMPYKGTDKPLGEIARELGVDAVVEGSALLAGDQVRITAQLVDAATENHLWAETYERNVADVLRVQSEVARAIAAQIDIELTPDQEAALAGAREVNPEVYEAYVRGMFHMSRNTPEAWEKGLHYLHQAVEIDPAEPLAYAGLAEGYVTLGHGGGERLDIFPRARAAAEQALKLDPDRAEAVGALAFVALYHEWDWAKAERLFHRALELNPSLAMTHYHYAWYLALFDRLEEAIEEHKRARDLDPLRPLHTAWLGALYSYAGRYDEAIVEARKALELNPDNFASYRVLSRAYSRKDLHDEAVAAAERMAELFPPLGNEYLGAVYAWAGRREDALRMAALPEVGPIGLFGRAGLYAALGDEDEAMRVLEQAHEARVPFVPWTRNDGFGFEALHDHPRFLDLMRRLNLPPPAEGQ
jgi:serine/threonine-protein kinase